MDSSICQQHRNKVQRQAKLLVETVQAKTGARVLVLGCGMERLCDYLSDRVIGHVLSRLGTEGLAHAGKVFLTNIPSSNSYRGFLEILLDWELIHRSRGEMQTLLQPFRQNCQLSIGLDATGLTWLVETSNFKPVG